MLVTQFTRNALAIRKERKRLEAQGYNRHETDWGIHRGIVSTEGHVILDAKISVCGLYVYTKVGPKPC